MKQITKAELQKQVNELRATNNALVNALQVLQVLAFKPEVLSLPDTIYNQMRAEAYNYNPFLSKNQSA